MSQDKKTPHIIFSIECGLRNRKRSLDFIGYLNLEKITGIAYPCKT